MVRSNPAAFARCLTMIATASVESGRQLPYRVIARNAGPSVISLASSHARQAWTGQVAGFEP